jgi:sugar O-acyltransferase (sialic acid O-acetyltransferase NeuD family)
MRVIFGAGGFAKETYLVFRRAYPNKGHAESYIDCFVCSDGDPLEGTDLRGVPVVGESHFFSQNRNVPVDAYVAIAAPAVRTRIVEKVRLWNSAVNFPTLIDPSVVMDVEGGAVLLGEGVILGIGAVLETDIRIGAFCQINMCCSVGHDSVLGNFSTASPGTRISGNVTLGDGVFCGAGSIILDGLSIAATSVLGAGAVVVKDIVQAGTYVGIPATLKTSR